MALKIKIDYTANRLTGFLLGLIMALTLLLSALEYKSGGAGGDFFDSDADDAAQDVELLPVKKQDDMIAVTQGRKAHAVTTVIKKVDEVPEKEMPAKLDPTDGNANDDSQQAERTDDSKTEDAIEQTPTDLDDNPLNFRVVERLPEFPGGMVAFMKWLTRNLQYPPEAVRLKLQGRVMVAFIIGKDGSISELKVVSKTDNLLNQEALRVLRQMPKWKPGEDKGKPCATYFCIPVNFNL